MYKISSPTALLAHISINVLTFIACYALLHSFELLKLNAHGNSAIIPIATYFWVCLPTTVALQRSGSAYSWVGLLILIFAQLALYLTFPEQLELPPIGTMFIQLYFIIVVYQSLYFYDFNWFPGLLLTLTAPVLAHCVVLILSAISFILIGLAIGLDKAAIAVFISYNMSCLIVGLVMPRLHSQKHIGIALLISLQILFLFAFVHFFSLSAKWIVVYSITTIIALCSGISLRRRYLNQISFAGIARTGLSICIGLCIFAFFFGFLQVINDVVNMVSANDQPTASHWFRSTGLVLLSTICQIGTAFLAINWATSVTPHKRTTNFISSSLFLLIAVPLPINFGPDFLSPSIMSVLAGLNIIAGAYFAFPKTSVSDTVKV